MVQEGQQNKSVAAKAAWPLLVLTAVLTLLLFAVLAVALLFGSGIVVGRVAPHAW